MDSPSNPPPIAADVSATSASSPPDQSPTVQESPFFSFASNLSPLKSCKTSRYAPRFLESDILIPPSVFSSPHLDLQHRASFFKREENNPAGTEVHGQNARQLNNVVTSFQNEVQTCSPMVCVDEYLADPEEVEDRDNSVSVHGRPSSDVPQKSESRFTGLEATAAMSTAVSENVRSAMFRDRVSGGDCETHVNQALSQIVNLQNADGQHNTWDAGGAESSRHESNGCIEDNQHQHGTRSHLQFGLVEGTYVTSIAPSGIHLHRGGITGPTMMGPGMMASNQSLTYFCSQNKTVMLERNKNVISDFNRSSVSVAASEVYENNQPGTQGVENNQYTTIYEPQVGPYDVASNQAEIVEDMDQSSPKRTRFDELKNKEVQSDESGSCKRCNCKRSKCLKLYCECFAAGVYCLDTCSCKLCFNKPEYEDTVQDTRQQVESRNPLAFAPKIVQQATTDAPSNAVEEGDGKTPSSARHKRGCNCKKSKCLKKYCECYQVNVGCFVGCRCEGCSNPYGRKPEVIYQRAERWCNTSHKNGVRIETTNQLFPKALQGIPDGNQFTPLPHQRAQSQIQSSVQSSAGPVHLVQSPMSLSDLGSPNVFNSASSIYDLRNFDDLPESLKGSANPPTKTNSPNKKCLSPPKFESGPQEMRSSHKFGRSVPSFPPLSPYSDSQEGNQDHPSDQNSAQTDKYTVEINFDRLERAENVYRTLLDTAEKE